MLTVFCTEKFSSKRSHNYKIRISYVMTNQKNDILGIKLGVN